MTGYPIPPFLKMTFYSYNRYKNQHHYEPVTIGSKTTEMKTLRVGLPTHWPEL